MCPLLNSTNLWELIRVFRKENHGSNINFVLLVALYNAMKRIRSTENHTNLQLIFANQAQRKCILI